MERVNVVTGRPNPGQGTARSCSGVVLRVVTWEFRDSRPPIINFFSYGFSSNCPNQYSLLLVDNRRSQKHCLSGEPFRSRPGPDTVTGILHVIFTLQVGYTPANFPPFFSFAPGIQSICSKCLIDLTCIPSGMSREGDLERLMGFSLVPLWRWYVSVGKPRLKELVFSFYGGCSSGVSKMTLLE